MGIFDSLKTQMAANKERWEKIDKIVERIHKRISFGDEISGSERSDTMTLLLLLVEQLRPLANTDSKQLDGLERDINKLLSGGMK